MNYVTKMQEEKKKALIAEGKAVIEQGLVIHRHQTLAGKPAATIWTVKSSKPLSNYYFPTVEQMEKHIQEMTSRIKAHTDMINKRKDERKATPEKLASLKVGDIYQSSWGYDQTNQEFWKVLEIRGQIVILGEMGHKVVNSSIGSDLVIPEGLTGKNVRRRIQFYNGNPYFKINSCFGVTPWDGFAKSETARGWGH